MRSNAVIVVLLTSLVAASYGFGIYLFAQLVPDMQATLGFDFSYVGAITASGQFGFLISAVLAAWLTPKVGGGLMILGSGIICAIALLLVPLSSNILVIGALLTVLAGTAATVFVPMVDVISRVVDYRFRGMAMGLVSSGTSYGVFVNSLLVPIYSPRGEWRTVWLLVGIISLFIALVVYRKFRDAGLFRREQLSTDSLKADSVALSSVQLFSRGSELMQPWVLTIWSMNFLIGFSTFPFQNYLSSYLRTELGFGVEYTAQIWATIGLVGMFAGLAVGWLSDKAGLRTAMLLVYVCVVLAALIFVVYPHGHWPLVAGVLFATAFYPIFGLIPAYVSKLATSTATAVAIFGIANVMQGTGGMLGNYGAGLLASHSGTFSEVYALIGVVGVILMVLTARLPSASRTAASAPCLLPESVD
ncbi:MFS transporter [Pseudomonas sp. 10B1]|uniref:MFS transporter n=1 Tax=unclassified Pseudomonas TaxID=196821 RepID=UPI002B226CBE|nr:MULTISPECIES: MFS transporter [unclassified Pseudomonas]MEA9992907.1 MFS transporter [Pseudomonas sp. AA4]MEB0089082.1 MFS transporter [Pseudomonas sp. RTI1]MEB0125715.1 MFS transporter [Pseudomonas sp. CCC1.2]MEB0151492.1 MFS transporter [Pseudomonas sp. CCC4.3]MEB0220495.1 MFS transporter [Pseudomonas sp. AB12(2023)]